MSAPGGALHRDGLPDAFEERARAIDPIEQRQTERAVVEMVADDDEPVEAEATVVRERDLRDEEAIDLEDLLEEDDEDDEIDEDGEWAKADPSLYGASEFDPSSYAAPEFEPSPHAEVYARVLEFARRRGALGITPDEVADAFGVSSLSVAPRITELKTFGHLAPNGLRRATRAGSLAQVLVARPRIGAGARAEGEESVERPEPAVVVLPSVYWRCGSCLTEVEVPARGRAPSWCQSCRTIGSLFSMPEDYEPEPRVEAIRHRPLPPQSFARPFAQPSPPPAPSMPLMPTIARPFATPSGRGREPQKATIVDPAEVEREPLVRSPSGVTGLDHVMGGGIAQGFVVMVAGPPGCGKSTICTQAGSGLAIRGTHFGEGCAYGSAEEDSDAVIETADRVAIANFKIVLATSCQALIQGLDETRAVVWIVDSLMAITCDGVDGEPGMPSQINACSTLLYQRAHAMPGTPYEGMPRRSIYLVAHGTKDGNMAGPMKALHSVDGGVLMEHVDPTGVDTKGNVPWAPAKDQTRPTGFVSARVYRKMRKASNRPIAYFIMQPEYLDAACTLRNPVGGRLDRVSGPEGA